MEKTTIIQGREVSSKDIEFIREMIKAHPYWGRTRLSKELAMLWNWRALSGQLKDMACRTFLLKLERQGYLTLPPRLYSLKSEGELLVSLFLIRLPQLRVRLVVFFPSGSR